MRKCSGTRCPMQSGYDADNCKITETCKYYTTPLSNRQYSAIFFGGLCAMAKTCYECCLYNNESGKCNIFKDTIYDEYFKKYENENEKLQCKMADDSKQKILDFVDSLSEQELNYLIERMKEKYDEKVEH